MASGRIDESQFGKISAHPHTSLCIHTWGFFIQCIIIKMCLHSEVWGCVEFFLKMQKNTSLYIMKLSQFSSFRIFLREPDAHVENKIWQGESILFNMQLCEVSLQ